MRHLPNMRDAKLAQARNLKLILQYDGTPFAGWQRQPQNPHQVTVQGELERVLSQVLQEPIEVIGAGRTDTGVHARMQVANFFTTSKLSDDKIRYVLNRLLPKEISVQSARTVSPSFHARFSATARTYRYFLTTEKRALEHRYKAFYPYPTLDVERMQRCAEAILGRHDFSSFCKAGSIVQTKFCTVYAASWKKIGKVFQFEITANRFLHSMVRLLVGTMLQVGRGEYSYNDFQRIFAAHDVRQAGASAKPNGLFLWKIHYSAALKPQPFLSEENEE
ncbi:MAG: tRNA pseudouridine(38-40) synthase TruA [Chloroherpetonaceae bacterium]|nr:tRNA pseudouridine(38-40) synthase TruA [Chloroherpetonaceae bacterium]